MDYKPRKNYYMKSTYQELQHLAFKFKDGEINGEQYSMELKQALASLVALADHDPLLGKQAKDKITGQTGIITSKHVYLSGCNQYGIQPPIDKEGKIPEKGYFDEGRIEVIGEGFTSADIKADEDGCDFRPKPS